MSTLVLDAYKPLLDNEMDLKEEGATNTVNAIIEIPKGTNEKYEMSTEILGNRISQDTTDSGVLRHVPAFYQQAYEEHGNQVPTQEQIKRHFREPLKKIGEHTWERPKKNRILAKIQFYAHDIREGEMEQLYGTYLEKGYNYFHYGAIPQTYENPLHSIKLRDYMPKIGGFDEVDTDFLGSIKETDLDKDLPGDGDPLDICVLSGMSYEYPQENGADNLAEPHFGQFKILGVYAMIDDGEIDWKVLACDIDYDKSNLSKDKEMVAKWFKYYKCKYQSSGDGNITITNTDAVKISICLPVETAIKVIGECHKNYNDVKQSGELIQLLNVKPNLKNVLDLPKIEKILNFFVSVDSRPKPAHENEINGGGGYRRKYSRNKKRKQKSRGRSKKRQQRRK